MDSRNLRRIILCIFALLFLLSSMNFIAALVKVEPVSSSLNICPGASFLINVTMSGVSNVYGYQFNFSYNQSVLNLVSISEGSYLSNGIASTTFFNYTPVPSSGIIKNVFGTKLRSGSQSPANGVLASIAFTVKSISAYPATSLLALSNIKVSDLSSNPLDNSKQDGQLVINSCPCTNGQTRSCTPSNTCAGIQTCSSGVWGACVSTQYFCDSDCDGDQECVNQNCAVCQCIGYDSRDCLTITGNCAGRENCSRGVWSGVCEILGYYCDANCDGTNDTCRSTPCASCSCTSGSKVSCYDGAAGTLNLGLCRNGTKSCTSGNWGSCTGEIIPTTETCDANNQDEDCDGTSNEGCACANGATRQCGSSNIGECRYGTQTCASGAWGGCIGNINATTEICDGKDNDCDNSIDESFTNKGTACAVGIGICQKSGAYVCNSQKNDTICNVTAGTGTTEICDGKDNDCDGQIDETFTNKGQSCSVGVGDCARSGVYVCSVNGSSTMCSVTPGLPVVEICDNKDNDCDGVVDESLVQGCYSGSAGTQGIGLCRAGTQTCAGGVWNSCTGDIKPATELCDGKDNDCDGVVDESLVQSCYSGPSGTQGIGLCKTGTQTCAGGVWNSCTGDIKPTTETCDVDFKDEDCDGTSNENCTCTVGQKRNCGTSNIGICKLGNQTCDSNGHWGNCTGSVSPALEVCDGLDNDCDGVVDDGLVNLSLNQNGRCSGNSLICTNGVWIANSSNYAVQSEICNGLDDDCDSYTDEELGNTTCGQGICLHTVNNCLSGVVQACNPMQGAVVELCDGLDNDCDNITDEGCGCEENWSCSDWSSCSANTQTRACTDNNNCSTNNNMPSLSQSCSSGGGDGSGGGGDGGGGGGGRIIPMSCTEIWSCANWGICDADGFRRRTCSDDNNCGTANSKPKELETCLYSGSCSDGKMNGDEEGIDCGGKCESACEKIPDQISIDISADSINAEVLDKVDLNVILENKGEQELEDIDIRTDKWSEDSEHVGSLSPGMRENKEISLSLPGDPNENNVEVQVVKGGLVIGTKTISVNLSVPKMNLKINKDEQNGKIYQAMIFDNRNSSAREIDVEFSVNKDKETYFLETGRKYSIGDNELFQKVDYLLTKNLPPGEYDVESVYYENGRKIGEVTSLVVLAGNKKTFNIKYLFYVLLIGIIILSGYIFFVNQKKIKDTD